MISMGHATMATTGVAIHEAKPMWVSVASFAGSGCSARLMAPLSPNVNEMSGPVRSSGTDALKQNKRHVRKQASTNTRQDTPAIETVDAFLFQRVPETLGRRKRAVATGVSFGRTREKNTRTGKKTKPDLNGEPGTWMRTLIVSNGWP